MNKLGVALDRALPDAEHRELADEGIVDDLEHVGDHVRLRIGRCLDRLRVGARAFDERRRIAFGGIRQQAIRDIQQFLHAGAGARGDETDRHQMAFAQALLESVVQFFLRQRRFAVVEVMAHHALVDLDHLVEDALVRVGDEAEIALSFRREEAISTTLPPLSAGRFTGRHSLPNSSRNASTSGGEVHAFRIDLVDHQHAREAALLRVMHHAARAVLDAVDGVDHHRARFPPRPARTALARGNPRSPRCRSG